MIEFFNNKYEIVKGEKYFDKELVDTLLTDYFEPYDYIFGDYAYDKLRLKGYYNSNNRNRNSINDIKDLDDYIKNYCAYGCHYFLLKKNKKCQLVNKNGKNTFYFCFFVIILCCRIAREEEYLWKMTIKKLCQLCKKMVLLMK